MSKLKNWFKAIGILAVFAVWVVAGGLTDGLVFVVTIVLLILYGIKGGFDDHDAIKESEAVLQNSLNPKTTKGEE